MLLLTNKAMTTDLLDKNIKGLFKDLFQKISSNLMLRMLRFIADDINRICLVINSWKSGNKFILVVFCNLK